MSEDEVKQILDGKLWNSEWLIGWRDVTDARASARTLIASVIPRVGVNDKFLLMLPNATARQSATLLGNLCSLVCDYIARQKVGGLALKYFTMKQIPVLTPTDYSESDLAFIVPRVLELTYTAHDLDLTSSHQATHWMADLVVGFCHCAEMHWDSLHRALTP